MSVCDVNAAMMVCQGDNRTGGQSPLINFEKILLSHRYNLNGVGDINTVSMPFMFWSGVEYMMKNTNNLSLQREGNGRKCKL